MRVPGVAAELSGTQLRKVAKDLENLARQAGAKGLAYITIPIDPEGQLRGPIGKHFSVELKLELIEAMGAEGGDLLPLHVRQGGSCLRGHRCAAQPLQSRDGVGR